MASGWSQERCAISRHRGDFPPPAIAHSLRRARLPQRKYRAAPCSGPHSRAQCLVVPRAAYAQKGKRQALSTQSSVEIRAFLRPYHPAIAALRNEWRAILLVLAVADRWHTRRVRTVRL